MKTNHNLRTHKYGAKKTTVDGITFDSKAEAKYYSFLKRLKERGEIHDFELQPEFILQDKFKLAGKTISAIKYKADFLIHHMDGGRSVVDVKGTATKDALIKRKLFMFRYPELPLRWVKDSRFGWMDYDDCKKRRR